MHLVRFEVTENLKNFAKSFGNLPEYVSVYYVGLKTLN